MADKLIPIREYADTAAQLAADNDVILDRQLVIEKNTGRAKIGDGVTAYNSLAYIFEAANNVDGSGTLNYYAKWTPDGNTLGDGLIFDSGGNTVNIYNANATNQSASIGGTLGSVTFNQGYNNVFSRNTLIFYNGGDASRIQGFFVDPGIAIGYAQTVTNPTGAALSLKGKGATSATFAQKWQNSGGTDLMGVRDDGQVLFGTQSLAFYPTANGTTISTSGRGMILSTAASSQGAPSFTVLGSSTITSGNVWGIGTTQTFAPSSGTGTWADLYSAPTINQIGGANGITRGLYINPTLTSAADWRAIELTNATGYGIYQTGAAPNSFAGSVTTAGKLSSTLTSVTCAAAATTFAVTSNVVRVTGDGGGNTIATITGGVSGQLLTLLFVDALVTITDTGGATANSIDLSAAFTSAAKATLTLIFDNNKWFEISRSVN